MTGSEHRAVDERKRAARRRRERAIARFRDQQLCKRNWVNLKEIVEWYAERGGRFDVAERDRAYDLLIQDLLDGDFEVGVRSKVLYLHPYTKMHRLTRRMLLDVLELDQSVRSEYIDLCWLPRPLLDAWLRKHELPASPARFEPKKKNVARPRDQRKPGRSLAIRVAVKVFIDRNWPKGVPAGVTTKAIAREFEQSPDGFAVSERTVRRALGGN